jgi:phage terminase large subunit-like protein
LDLSAVTSTAEMLATLSEEELDAVLASMDPATLKRMREDWAFWARPNQLPPGPDCECGCGGDWLIWLILSGRGWGKTRTGAEWVHENTNLYGHFHLVGATTTDARDIMVMGQSGILATQKSYNKVTWQPTYRRLTWENGAVALLFSADEPERFRGVQCEAAWADELAAWRYPESWVQLQLGLRLGPKPRTIVTTTPRPTVLIKKLLKAARVHVTKGSTYDNQTNLSEAFIEEVRRTYEGTRFGRQEVYAEILSEAEGALWTHDGIEEHRISKEEIPSQWARVVVAVDPAVSFGEEAAETGIIVAALDHRDHGYVLADWSGKYKPEQWARRVVSLYHEYMADRIIAEKNQGGLLVEHTILVVDQSVPVKLVNASRNKITRAEPVAAAYEKGRIHHVGYFDRLEEQMCEWEAGDPDSPDRLDAMVWAMTELVVGANPTIHGLVVGNELGLPDGVSSWG